MNRRKIVISDELLEILGQEFVSLGLHHRSRLTFESFVALFLTPQHRLIVDEVLRGKTADLGDPNFTKVSRKFWEPGSFPRPVVRQTGTGDRHPSRS